ncbi:MAG: lytic transglycosylase domain-containing protein [Deltaproteobacteria bacterium]|nr:lytic transglycosylase domain-containing protein [Deltaproteobacteria bacterium]
MRPAWCQAVALAAGLAPTSARAEIYAFTDPDGVIHITNIPDDPRYRPYPLEGSNNTFEWKDDVGKLRRVHRVHIDKYDAVIREAAQYYSLPAPLVKAVIAVESSFEPEAVSHAGAVGLMQLIPSTARAMHVRDPFDPRDNIYGGVRYLRVLANQFGGDVRLTVAAYNAGPKAVERAKGVPNIQETKQYLARVLTLYHHYASAKTEQP